LKKNNINVKLCDPFYSPEEIKKITGVESFEFPKDLSSFDAVVAVVDHNQFRRLSGEAASSLKNCKFILDNMGMWQTQAQEFTNHGIEYHVAGDANWLGNA